MPTKEYSIKASIKGVSKFLSDIARINKRINSARKQMFDLKDVYKAAGIEIRKFGDSLAYANAKSGRKLEFADAAKQIKLQTEKMRLEMVKTGAEALSMSEKFAIVATGVSTLTDGLALVIAPLVAIGGAAVKAGKLLIKGLGIASVVTAKMVKAAVVGMAKVFLLLTAPVRSAANAIKGFFERITSIAAGVLLRDIVFGLLRAFKEFAGSVQDAAGALQTLEARLKGIVASQAARAGMAFGNAMSFAEEKARGLVQWVEKLSITAPIKLESISNTLSLANAMDFAGAAGLRLSRAVITYTAGMGLTDEVTTRIIQNFAQMARAGKVTSTEIRDLTRGALLPLTEILNQMREQTGYASTSLDEFRKIAASGAVPVQEFFNAFVQVVERDLPNALKTMGETIDGVKIRMKNLFDVLIGGRVLGQVFSAIAKDASALVDALSTPDAFKNASYIGAALVEAYKRLSAALRAAGKAIVDVVRAFSGGRSAVNSFVQILAYATAWIVVLLRKFADFVTAFGQKAPRLFSDIANKAKVWGANIISSLASGMVQAAVYVVQALNYVASIIRSLLEAHSPPKILPDLTKWGAAAMASYIEGWKKADYSAFKEIAGTLSAYIRSIPSLIDDKKTVVLSILGTREQIVNGINNIRKFGKVTRGVIENISKAMAEAPKGVARYVRSLFSVEAAEYRLKRAKDKLAGANEVYDYWQNRVSETSKKYSDILNALNKQLRRNTAIYNENIRLKEIDEAIATGLLTEEEKKRLQTERNDILIKKQIRRVEDQRDAELKTLNASLAAAEARRAAAQAEVDAAQKRLELAREQFEVAKSYIEFQTEQNNLIKEYLELLKAARGGSQEITANIQMPQIDLSGLPSPQDFEFDLSGIFDNALADVESRLATFSTNISGVKTKLQSMIPPELSQAISDLSANIGGISAAAGGAGGVVESARKLFEGAKATFLATATTIKDNLLPAFRDLNDAIKEVTGNENATLLSTIGRVLTGLFLIGMSLSIAFATAATKAVARTIRAFNNLKEGVTKIFRGIWKIIKGIVETVFSILAIVASVVISAILYPFSLFNDKAKELYDGAQSAIDIFVDGVVQGFADLATGVWDTVSGMFETVKAIFYDFSVGGVVETIATFVGTVIDFFKNLSNELVGNSIIPDMLDAITEQFGRLSAIFDGISNFVAKTKDKFEEMRAYIAEKVEAVRGRFDSMKENAEELRAGISEKIANIKTYFGDMWDVAKEKFGNLLSKIDNTVSKFGELKTEVATWLEDWKGKIAEAVSEFVSVFFNPMKDKFDSIKKWFSEAKEKLGNFIQKFSAIGDIVEKVERLAEAVWKLIDAFRNLVIPSQFKTESPPPFEVGLAGINRQIDEMNRKLPTMAYHVSRINAPEIVARGVGNTTITRQTFVEVNPTYRNVQSEASVYYDVLAALGAAT